MVKSSPLLLFSQQPQTDPSNDLKEIHQLSLLLRDFIQLSFFLVRIIAELQKNLNSFICLQGQGLFNSEVVNTWWGWSLKIYDFINSISDVDDDYNFFLVIYVVEICFFILLLKRLHFWNPNSVEQYKSSRAVGLSIYLCIFLSSTW